ncbi:FecR family protein [Chitinophaga qingshengii]|uniref:FecR domain-containing protein n=1 Tax=Chitinophaga qingshengii TaxID=1569794 RepID=A0ABR7TFQ2_9BACT|nr:FecR family protein [Chitinophaga qingshengii]MBC9929196.1 FecR domain-containing protein [Chitinophaga qingshengii]
MDQSRIADIVERIAANTATDEDLAVYSAWCDARQAGQPDIGDVSAREARILKNIHRQTGMSRQNLFPWRLAAAAALTGILAGGFFLYQQNYRPQIPVAMQAKPANDATAGKNSATLTLANGKKILLSDTQAGKLADQDGAEVTKTADGSLAYHGGNDAVTVQYNTLSTARGEQYQITLSDGTKVWLNAATTLTFPASFAQRGERSVEVNGEAYFEVAGDPARPFKVRTNNQQIQVLGTSFNVNNYADEPLAKTTLLQGAVKINDAQVLKPGQQAISGKNSPLKVVTVNTDGIIAWKNGYFEFNDENIYQVMRKIARWYDMEVVYEGDIPTNEMEGTISRFENVSKVLSTIEKAGLLKFHIANKKIYVSKY